MIQTSEFDQLRKMSVDSTSLFAGAHSGRIQGGEEDSEVRAERVLLGSGQTPVSRGLTEGYSPADIAYFYIARELGTSWLAHLKVAFKEFCHDVQFEERYAGPEMFCCNHLKKGGRNE